jgi:hypothetical protein
MYYPLFRDNGFQQFIFFSFTHSGSVFTASLAVLDCQLATDNSKAGGHFAPTS